MPKKAKLTASQPEMAEGYRVLAKELKRFAAMTSKIVNEVLPEWEDKG